MYRTLLIILSILVILAPFSGIPGGAEDLLTQAFGVVILLLVLLLPKRETRAKKVEEPVTEEVHGI